MSKSAIFLVPCELQIWQMTLKNNRVPILCYLSFHSHWWIQLELQSGNAKFGQNRWFFPCVTLKFNAWPWKTIQHLFYASLSFVHHFIAIGEFKLELQSGNAKLGQKFWPLWPWALASDLLHGHYFLSMVITLENFIMIRWQEHCEKGVTDGWTDWRTDRCVLRAAWSQLKQFYGYQDKWLKHVWFISSLVIITIWSKLYVYSQFVTELGTLQ